MAIEHRMDGALGRDRNSGESAQEALANLARTPARVLALHVQDEVFHLEGKLIRIAEGPSASVRQPLHPTLLVATKDFVARLARDANSLQGSAICSSASRRATNCSLSSFPEHSFHGITPSQTAGGSVTHVSG